MSCLKTLDLLTPNLTILAGKMRIKHVDFPVVFWQIRTCFVGHRLGNQWFWFLVSQQIGQLWSPLAPQLAAVDSETTYPKIVVVRIFLGFDTISYTKTTEKQHVTQVIVLCISNSSELANRSTLLTRLAFACVKKMCWRYGFIHFNYMWYENLFQKIKLFFPFKWISCRQHLWTFYRLARICASAPERWYQKTPLLNVSLLGGLNMFNIF